MHILCVDDDADFLDLTATFLEQKLPSATVHTATRLGEANDYLTSHSVNCIVSDYEMPEQTGLEFLESVRDQYPDLPFILFTAKGSEEIASQAISAGVTDYLQKRGTEQYDRLAKRIRHAVAEYQTEHQLKERLKELTAIQTISNLLSENQEYSTKPLQQIVEYIPRSLQYPEQAVAQLIVNGDTFTSSDYESPAYCLTAHDVTLAGTELELTVGYVDPTVAKKETDPFLPEEKELLRTILQLITAHLDRKHVVSDLQEADRRLQLILENTTAVMYLKDADGRYVFVNAEYERLFDLQSPEIVGQTDADVHSEAMADAVWENDQRVLNTGEPLEVEERITVGDAERIFLSLKVPTRNNAGEVDGVFGVSTDITERKHREQQLEDLNHTIPQLLNADTVEEVAAVGVEAARDVLGLEACAIHLYDDGVDGLVPRASTTEIQNLVGELPTFENGEGIAWRVYSEGSPVAIDDVRDDLDTYNPETALRSELYLPLGAFGILIAGSPTPSEFDHQDETVGELLATHLVTALHQIEQEQQLRDREDELEERNERLEQFASMVSHDLRNPLSVATGRLDLYRETGDASNLDDIERSLTRIEELVTDLTALARHGTTDGEHEPVSLPEIAHEAWSLIDTRSATLSTEECIVTGDRSQFTTLFENLFRNAVGHGGPDVTVRVGPLDNGFFVEDTGEGIDPEQRDTVFEHGYTTGFSGSGIGLTIVNRIAQAHNWTVSLSKSSEGGARFEFRDVAGDI
ncbi:hybrid sensor histidine kinase/response regulator [Haloarcula sp. GH36]|uniref:hybrid sensor histidine kinase/response regulator n=1 Tax=Haloarcula montana TaxID=3111776 RepID=UPI002D770BF6|nr:PAS domain-containing protein [Haloarcula sp. GH36]